MKAVSKYPGAKNRLAKWILSYIPEHDVYLEPFFGSGAVFFNKQRCHIETVNDLHREVTNFFRVLRDNGQELANQIAHMPYNREEYSNSYEESSDSLERARRFSIHCWQGFGNGNLYQNGFKSGQQKVSPNPAKGWKKLPGTLTFAIDRIQGTQIEQIDAIELIERYNTEDVFIYCDPPYVLSTRKSNLYKREMSDEMHIRLLHSLFQHPGKVLLSGYDNELYNEKLVGWSKVTKDTNAEHGLKRTETLWANYPLNEQISLFSES